MKEFTKEMCDIIWSANDSVRGTSEYLKYHVQCDKKMKNYWKFTMWTIPTCPGFFKSVRGKLYIVSDEGWCGTYRYEVSEEIKKLLGI